MLLYTNIGCLVALAVFAVTIVYCFSRKTVLANRLGLGITVSTLVLVLYFININIETPLAKEFCVVAEYAAGLWVIYAMTFFTAEMCRLPVSSRLSVIATAVMLVDSALVFSTPINRFMGNVEIKNLSGINVARFEMKPMFILHLLIMLILYLAQFYMLIRAYLKTSGYTCAKYIILALAYIIIGLPNALFLFIGGHTFDSFRWVYTIGTLLVFYDTFFFSSRRLVRRLRTYVDDIISDATVVYDSDNEIIQVNKAAKELFPNEEWKDRTNLIEAIGGVESGAEKRWENDGRIFNIVYSDIMDKKGFHVATTFVFQDITESEKRLEREHLAAITDPLTQSYNRMGFFEAARQYMKTRGKDTSFVVIISGIYNFKGINSLYGTKAGDEVLKEIARKLHELHHKYGFVYGRTAEGKFASLVPFIAVEEVASELSHINIDLGDSIEIHAEMCHGFVKIDDEVKSFDFYYERALLALARAKEMSRTTALEYSEDMEDNQHKQQMLLSEMHIAIDEGEFFIELQPQIDLNRNRVVGAEALVRWNHPSLGRIPPNEFIPLFENNGTITFLDHFVWEEAAKTVKKFLDEGTFSGSVSVNVSRMDIINTDVPLVFEMLAHKYDIPPSKLHVEITESACVDSPEPLIEAMTALRERGFMVEIDDFGSGYSSLDALMKLPFDIVKLDMAFMKQKEMNEKSEVVISSIARMIHNLRASIIVEGVETESNVKNAIHFNADVAQGYYYSKPVSKEKFLEIVKEYNG